MSLPLASGLESKVKDIPVRERLIVALDVPSSDEHPDSFVYDPDDPCPTRGGALLMPGTYARGPVEQEKISELPYNGRHFLETMLFTPGVVPPG